MISLPRLAIAALATGLAVSAFAERVTAEPRGPEAACVCEPSRTAIQRMIIAEALARDVPPELALAVAQVESGFSADAESSKGARGVMQIMPATALREYDVPGDDLWRAETNVSVGVRYLRSLYERYDYRWSAALSHYNGGVLEGAPASARPHRYTERYVESVMDARAAYEFDPAVQQLIADAAGSDALLGGEFVSRDAPRGDSWLSPSERFDADVAAFVARAKRRSAGAWR